MVEADCSSTILCADPPAKSTDDPVVQLRLVATSDLHACLLPYDYFANRPMFGNGLGEIARQIAQAREETANCLLFDNGDFLQGSPLADFVASVERRRRAHPMITAFNTLGYDAVTLGNHDFDYGLDFLHRSLAQARFPVVSANVATRIGKLPTHDRMLVPPFTILRRKLVDTTGRKHNLRIGVIGFAPPQIEDWERHRAGPPIRTRGIVETARAWLPRLKAAGADLIVALAHSGIGPMSGDSGMEHAATALAALPEVDVVIAGHSHLIFPGPGFADLAGVDPIHGSLAGKPAVMPGHSGSHLGIIDLCLSRTEVQAGSWRITDQSVRLIARAAARPPVTLHLKRALTPDHRATLAWARRSLGQTRVPISTHFATCAPSAAMELVAAAKVDHVRRALSGSALAGLPVLASVSPFRAGGLGGALNYTEVPAGQFRMRNLCDLYPFQNALVTLTITAAEAADWLERSASIFHQVRPGQTDVPLHDLRMPGFAFDVIPGLDYAIDLSQPPRFDRNGDCIHPHAQRIVGLSLQGRPLAPDEPLLLVTNNHRASRIPAQADGGPQIVLADGVRVPAIIAEYIRAKEIVGARPSRNWHFLPMPGSSVRVATGSHAASHLADVAHLRPEYLHKDDAGFLHYRLHL